MIFFINDYTHTLTVMFSMIPSIADGGCKRQQVSSSSVVSGLEEYLHIATLPRLVPAAIVPELIYINLF